jgi:hypothetical protein
MTSTDLTILRRQLVSELGQRCKLILAGDPPMSDIRDIQLEIEACDQQIAALDADAQAA